MSRLRQYAEHEDLPVSEVIRRASETWLARYPDAAPPRSPKVPVFHLGKIWMDAEDMRDSFYAQ